MLWHVVDLLRIEAKVERSVCVLVVAVEVNVPLKVYLTETQHTRCRAIN